VYYLFMANLSRGPVEVRSAGSEPADQVSPAVAPVQALLTTVLPTNS